MQGTLLGAHIAGTIGGVAAPGPAGLGFEIAALTSDIGLKNTPPSLIPPGNLVLSPNNVATGSAGPYRCVYRFGEAIPSDSRSTGIEADFGAMFYVPYNPLEDVWSNLNAPFVYHPHATIGVSVDNPYLSRAGYPQVDAATRAQLEKVPEFPAGRHALKWEASTSMNVILDVALPTVLIAVFAYAEHQIAGKVAAEATKQGARKWDRIATAASVAFELGLIAVDVSDGLSANQWYKDTSVTTAVNSATQTLTIWDIHPPYIRDTQSGATQISQQTIQLQATDFGGVRFGRVADALRARFAPIDDCGRPFVTDPLIPSSTLLKLGATENLVTWETREIDGGPYQSSMALASNQRFEAENIVTTLVQRVTVVDTQAPILVPPAGFARYSATPINLALGQFPLGRPLVVDLADPAPAVTNNAPSVLDVGRRHFIDWRATDAAGNSTAPAPQYRQIVTIKAPGTNTVPMAAAKSAATLTSRPVEVQLTGVDTDLIDGRVDPLAFEIESYPPNGQFEAPLLPFFIEDFRLSPVGETEDGRTLARTSPLKHLADSFRLAGRANHGTFLTNQICNAPAGSVNRTTFNGVIPVNFVYEPTYIYVGDDGFYYVRDKFWVCGESSNNNPDFRATLSPIPRLSKWSDAGELVAMRPLYVTDSTLYADPWPAPAYPVDDFSVDQDGRIWVELGNFFTAGGDLAQFFSFDSNLADQRFHGSFGSNEQQLTSGEWLIGLTGDSQLGLLYELRRNANCGGFLEPPCAPGSSPHSFVVRSASTAVNLSTEDAVIGRIPVHGLDDTDGTGLAFEYIDVKVDSRGNVYILDGNSNRVHKFSPTVRNDAGVWDLGAQIGWLGSCTTNLLDPSGVPFNGCDEQLGVSRGYACSDATCGRAAITSGSAAGKFNAPRSIEIDPRDILYVADTGNSRVQRFGPDGTFAGEAKSTGSGVNQGADAGFILGNMGQPKQLAVNSSSLYVMEPDPQNGDNFVHVFKTIPFYDITDASAKVKYVSEFDFQGTDGFTYVVNDGIARSAPAAVSVAVTRAFRAPERLLSQCFADATLATEMVCTLPEDGAVVVRLSAYDLDGFLSTGGLDMLTFNVLEPPAHGTFARLSTTDNSAVYRYTPAANFNGADALSFEAFDGVAASLERKRVELAIAPRPDAVAIAFPANLRAARGFQRLLTASYSDIDADTISAPSAVSLQWGDGASATSPGWAGSGRRDPNGREIGPQEPLGLGSGLLVGGHLYAATGNYTLRATMANAAAEALPDTVATANVEVIEATVVGARLAAPAQPVTPAGVFPLVIDITNFAPQGWAGLSARSTQVSLAVPAGLTIVTLDGRCTAGQDITCSLGDLAPGQTAPLTFAARIDLPAARAESVYDVRVEIADAGPKMQPTNLGIVTIRVADRDADGAIDADDVFPDDARYSADTDGDGLPDEWERAFGFDPTVADDAALDGDLDGFTTLQEFTNGSYPLLADKQVAEAGATLVTTSASEDRFGIAIAGGDLNLDGYADTVIGASRHGGAGAAFIAYGSANGASPSLVRIGPSTGMTDFGRSVAVADFDGNGYPDVAIGSNNAVSVHVNNGQILSAPDFVLAGATAQSNLGIYLAAGDLDADGKADLVATGQASGANGHVHIYFSRRGFAAPPLAFLQLGASFSESAAIADVDGDQIADLLVGGSGQVHGFRAAHNNWQTATTLTASFVLTRPPSNTFGFSLASGADIGGDGVPELVVGAYQGAGQILVYDSRDSYWTQLGPGLVSTVPPRQIINGLDSGPPPDGFGDQFGVRVALGRLDTDAFADVVVGANRAGLRDAGQIQIYRGSPAGLAAAPQIERGSTDRDLLGYYVAIPGDVDGDGFADIAAGAPEILTAQNPVPGRGYVQVFEHAFAAVDPAQDPDDDGVRSALDNCPTNANTDQADIDRDGAGNLCDGDADGDGFSNTLDNCPLIASSDQTNSDTDALGNLCDNDDDNDDALDVDDKFPTDPHYSVDTDGDGMPDQYETQHGLNPANAADASADLDADGRSNVDEFRAGTNIQADDVAPTVSAPADVAASSIGAYTRVSLGAATAADAKDGALTATPSDAGPYRPGRHLVEWRARDAAGNEAVDTQQVDVIPRVDFLGATQYTAEGAIASVTAKLNGAAVSYPVSVPYTLGGSAVNGADYFVSGTLEITGGTTASLDLATATDGTAEGEETVVVTMGTPVNAVAGNTTEHTVRIVETNLAPRLAIRIAQAGAPRSTIVAGDGAVTMTVGIDDPNVADTHAIDWRGTDSVLVPNQGFNTATFTFDPAGLVARTYTVRVRVTDNGSPAANTAVERLIAVVATAPALAAGVDSDGDGSDDATEGLADANQNGISDYLEPTTDVHLLTALTGGRRVLQARAGFRLSLGSAAIASGADATVTLGDVANHGNYGQSALNAQDNRFVYPTGLYDFEVHGFAAAGDSTQIVIALPAALPAQASYRKYVSPLGWHDFVIDASNQIASAPGSLDACPAPGSNAYSTGVNAGHFCVQLTIKDGGPNDADGAANGVLRDPGGAAVVARPPTVTVALLTAVSRTVGAGTANVVVLPFRLNSDSTDVTVNGLTLTASGSGNDTADVRAVKLWVDRNGDGAVDAGDTQIGSGTYQTDNGSLQLQLASPLTLPFGNTDFLVTYDL